MPRAPPDILRGRRRHISRIEPAAAVFAIAEAISYASHILLLSPCQLPIFSLPLHDASAMLSLLPALITPDIFIRHIFAFARHGAIFFFFFFFA